MILAQVQPIINQVIMPDSGIPWHVYIAAVIGGLIAIVGWIVVHRTSQSRDLQNWRRTALLEATSALIEASENRFEAINKDKWVHDTNWQELDADKLREDQRKMRIAFYQIRLCDSPLSVKSASEILKLHERSEYAFERIELSARGGEHPELEPEELESFGLKAKMNEATIQIHQDALMKTAKKIIHTKKRKIFRKCNHDTEHVDPDLKSSSQIRKAKAYRK
ncbi:hypothetical protein [Rhodococcus sp. (in: high G+C Gram-positive bacteria)]|uniref:hypothetical protein n=1 Tax=Rhodococcus sp. TaxID=1831 RepID=UPI001A204E45|nr:hypothetical protein [Rhodococcus sp. (in: high G+C Gram-positive bacteria)]MBJ7479710.1 hypothetical protein [Rhodococcus sp. (in: high G+C Gram-positive bacteria)]